MLIFAIVGVFKVWERRWHVHLRAREETPADEVADAEAPEEAPEPLTEGFDESDPSTWGDPGRNEPCPCGLNKNSIGWLRKV